MSWFGCRKILALPQKPVHLLLCSFVAIVFTGGCFGLVMLTLHKDRVLGCAIVPSAFAGRDDALCFCLYLDTLSRCASSDC
jgi:hypothetical protein